MIIKIKSFTNPTVSYDVNVWDKTCTCMAFKKSPQYPCKHLNLALYGTKPPKPPKTKAKATKAQLDPSNNDLISNSVLKSATQKAVRRNKPEKAIVCAKQHIIQNESDFLRRLSIIVIEDVILHPYLPKVIELTKRISRKDEKLTEEEKDFLLNMVKDLAETETRDDFVHTLKFEETTPEDWEKIGEKEKELVNAIKYRAAIGGMKGDTDMMTKYASVWAKRFSTGWNIESINKLFKLNTDVKFKDVRKIKQDDIMLEALDFHCSPLVRILLKKDYVVNLINSRFPNQDVEARLKDIIWKERSCLNLKTQIGLNRPMNPYIDYPHKQLTEKEIESYKLIYKDLEREIKNISTWCLSKSGI